MLGVVLRDEIAPQVAAAALGRGLIVNAIGRSVLRLVPPLILTAGEADEAVRRLGLALEDVA
jgi:acetylornithine/succinyldiaminopimelate/putrescine aminotransferase